MTSASHAVASCPLRNRSDPEPVAVRRAHLLLLLGLLQPQRVLVCAAEHFPRFSKHDVVGLRALARAQHAPVELEEPLALRSVALRAATRT